MCFLDATDETFLDHWSQALEIRYAAQLVFSGYYSVNRDMTWLKNNLKKFLKQLTVVISFSWISTASVSGFNQIMEGPIMLLKFYLQLITCKCNLRCFKGTR